MSRGRWGGLAGALVFALACSRTPTMDHEQLASERKQLHSLEHESVLFDQVVAQQRVTLTYARIHSVYLHRAARDVAQTLATARPAPGAEAEFQQVSADATRLEQRFVALLLRFQ
jgi:hypothetical protein